MKIVKLCLTCLFLALLMEAADSTASAWAEPYRKIFFAVVPGKGAGPIRLGHPLPQEFLRKLGPPSKKTQRIWLWTKYPNWPDFEDGVIIKLDDKGLVDSVMLANVPFKTDRGLSVGDSQKRALKLYPEGGTPGRYKPADSWSVPGAWFEFNRGKLFMVAIIRPPVSRPHR